MTTNIEWTDETWNPVTGCSKVSQGCKNCYAERLWPKVEAAQRMREHFEWNKVPRRAFTDVRCHPERLDQPLRWRKPKRIFVNSMSDLFHEDVPFSFIDEVWGTMIEAPQHQFQILTKRPERMREYLSRYIWSSDARITAWPLPNVWLGVSVEDQATADERIPLLLQTPAAVRFVSYEPALGRVDFTQVKVGALNGTPCYVDSLTGLVFSDLTGGASFDNTPCKLTWVIAGGESGPKARPSNPDWFRSVRDQCANAGVAFFFKQWGEFAPTMRTMAEVAKSGRKLVAVPFSETQLYPASCVDRVGKQAAGRTLDGRTHDEYPDRSLVIGHWSLGFK